MLKLLHLCVAMLLGLGIASSQPVIKDSIAKQLKTQAEDSAKVVLYYQYGETLQDDQPDSAAFYFKKGKAIAERIGFKKGIADFSSNYIVLLNNKGAFREALNVSREALEIYKTLGDKKDLAVAYINVGSEWQYLSDFELAAENYLQAKQLSEAVGEKRLQRISNNNLGAVFIELKEFEKGKQYARQALKIAQELKNEYAVSSSMYNIATAMVQLKEYDSALVLFREIESIGKKTEDDILILDGWLGQADAYNALRKDKEAIDYFDRVLTLSTQKQMPEYEMYACMGKSDVMVRLRDFTSAGSLINTGIAIARKQESRLELKDLFLKAAVLYEEKGSLDEALDFRKQFELLNDSLVGEKSKTVVANLEARYEFEKKENTIRQLGADNELQALAIARKNLINYLLIGGAIILLAILALSYRNYKQKQVMQQRRINELETEKRLSAAEAVLKGEEQERSRLAKDLHDGLGGMLSGIKYSFQSMKGNMIMTADNIQAFERSMDMLDSSIKEMRRVAHNLMPEALVKFGLETALKDFCNDINQTGALQVSYQSLGLAETTIDQTSAITIYRIVQELVNNIMKHAGATEAIVQVSNTNGRLSVTVEDNGKGFDTAVLKGVKGIGWSNIYSRLELLNGIADVQSEPGKGTSVHIELNAA